MMERWEAGGLLVFLLLMWATPVWAQDAESAPASAPQASEPDTPASDAPAANAAPPERKSAEDYAYEVKLKNLEEKVNELKEKIFRSKTRLMLLREQITKGVIAGSKVILTHQNLMGSGFKLESVAYYLDGAPIYGKIDMEGDLNTDKVLEIHNSTISPGNHMVSIYMVYRGDSSVFKYVQGVQVKLKSSYSFKAEEGKLSTISVRGVDNGGVLTPFAERPAVEVEQEMSDLNAEDLDQAGDTEVNI